MIDTNECKLKNLISSTLQEKGRISFEEYMQLALYAPELGYYSGNAIKFGKAGDFVTAPLISSLFSDCLARNFLGIISEIKEASILEFGAGTGKMAADILIALEQQQALPEHYFIFEISKSLRRHQQETLNKLPGALSSRVVWLDEFPDPKLNSFKGLILANEVLDAMPVRRFCFSDDHFYEYYVVEKEGKFEYTKVRLKNEQGPIFDRVKELLFKNLKEAPRKDGDKREYIFEINFHLSPWLKNMASCLKQGAVLIIDYGFPRHELYHPDRFMGTLMCHHKHKAHPDPFFAPGAQDITAHVDFSLIAEVAQEVGMDVLGFNSQAGFLLNSGLIELLQASLEGQINEAFRVQQNHAVQLLTSPAEMGELFKVMGLGKELEPLLLPGFSMYDQRHRL